MIAEAAALIELGSSLVTLIAKQTVPLATAKIQAIRDEKSVEKVRATYDEIINQLMADRAEAIRLAQAYKAEVDRMEISDEDIAHLDATVEKILELVPKFSPDTDVKAFGQIKELLSADTLKTMQLLGFNYKAAIGEPLTEICAGKITAWGRSQGATVSRPTTPQPRKR